MGSNIEMRIFLYEKFPNHSSHFIMQYLRQPIPSVHSALLSILNSRLFHSRSYWTQLGRAFPLRNPQAREKRKTGMTLNASPNRKTLNVAGLPWFKCVPPAHVLGAPWADPATGCIGYGVSEVGLVASEEEEKRPELACSCTLSPWDTFCPVVPQQHSPWHRTPNPQHHGLLLDHVWITYCKIFCSSDPKWSETQPHSVQHPCPSCLRLFLSPNLSSICLS